MYNIKITFAFVIYIFLKTFYFSQLSTSCCICPSFFFVRVSGTDHSNQIKNKSTWYSMWNLNYHFFFSHFSVMQEFCFLKQKICQQTHNLHVTKITRSRFFFTEKEDCLCIQSPVVCQLAVFCFHVFIRLLLNRFYWNFLIQQKERQDRETKYFISVLFLHVTINKQKSPPPNSIKVNPQEEPSKGKQH